MKPAVAVRLKVVLAVVLVSALHVLIWLGAREVASPADVVDPISSLSYTPFRDNPDRDGQDKRFYDVVIRDLAVLSQVTKHIRTYSTSFPIEQIIPEQAEKNGLGVSLGIWLGADEARNQAEKERALELIRTHRSVIKTVYVGNETQVRGEVPIETLIAHIRDFKKASRNQVEVTTGETWDVWHKYPELVRAVDVISAHVLPYWEGIPAEEAVASAFKRYDDLRTAYPGKRVTIAEFGWPSQGYNNGAAQPGAVQQATVLRDFISRANRLGISYNIIEAKDQPWKTVEGSVGAYWGIFDVNLNPKFPLRGLVEKTYRPVAIAAVAIGFLLSLFAFRRGTSRFSQAFIFSVSANLFGVAAGFALIFPLETYLNVGATLAWAISLLLMMVLAAIVLAKISEVVEVSLGSRPRRLLNPLDEGGVGASELKGAWVAAAGLTGRRVRSDDEALGPVPKVSIQIPAYKEEPDMLIQTLDSVAALDYPDFEALVIINNTTDPYYWKPVAEHCEKLGPRFRFVYLPSVAGFKAGALNEAMAFVSPEASILALIDADYIVDPQWLANLVPTFSDPKIAIVQAPQDHRDGSESLFKSFLNDEYAGFFDIGMVQRNEDDAIIAHGTMLLIRRSAFDAAGGWATDTIVEDTELGFRLFKAGYSAQYTNRRYGWGVLPDTYLAYKTQRHRWAYGAIQIIRKHWRDVLPGAKGLNRAQKMDFITGWLVWLSDALGASVAVLSLLWVPVVIWVGTRLPLGAIMTPAIAAVLINVLHALLLYRLRVKISPVRAFRAAIAAMSLQFTVARAVFKALITDKLPFQRTQKGGARSEGRKRWENWPETLLGLGLIGSSVLLWFTNDTRITEIYIYAIAMGVISIPHLATVFMGLLERFSGPAPTAPEKTGS
ncbi:glycosyltransferase [Phaeovibrio sulfidiphilus]|uniref:Beta-monoglucosyldiacylglycerol synthase n=1 Tax=Phaeovibrio sulfidiphilus TaxID=1220600 RepID=A0A8J6YKY6_9PROT|nr:glycosyltransferase family 2 protein [Phaeovibrio sulfidiphilus]MBE1236215.1 glycosyltransferase [Phaeovibrio sulfidiphilus]